MAEFKKWYFSIYLFFVRILIVSMIIGISFPVHVFGTTELKQLYALSAFLTHLHSRWFICFPKFRFRIS